MTANGNRFYNWIGRRKHSSQFQIDITHACGLDFSCRLVRQVSCLVEPIFLLSRRAIFENIVEEAGCVRKNRQCAATFVRARKQKENKKLPVAGGRVEPRHRSAKKNRFAADRAARQVSRMEAIGQLAGASPMILIIS